MDGEHKFGPYSSHASLCTCLRLGDSFVDGDMHLTEKTMLLAKASNQNERDVSAGPERYSARCSQPGCPVDAVASGSFVPLRGARFRIVTTGSAPMSVKTSPQLQKHQGGGSPLFSDGP